MSKSKVVYVVTSGSYSDYGVDAIFSTREKAEEWMNAFPDYDCNGIEEWPLDPVDVEEQKQGRSLWHVQMLRDGTTNRVQQTSGDISRYSLKDAPRIWRPANTAFYLNASVWAKDAMHAVKIVNEIRTRMIAEGEWEA